MFNILLIEDNPGDVRLIQELLSEDKKYLKTLHCASQLSEALKIIAEEKIDIILMDLGLPDSQGLETFLKIAHAALYIPIIILTGLDDDEISLKTIEYGAQDYLIKGQISNSVLTRSIRYGIERKQLMIEFSKSLTTIIDSEQQLIFYSQLLEELNRPIDSKTIIYNIILIIKSYLNIDAVGIRLKEGYDYPYFVSNGFSEEFLELENFLCSVDENGEIIRDSEGRPSLECMCGNILHKRFDPSLPFFTEFGSFWTNSTTRLLASTTEKERLTRTRNYCNTAGYESLVLIPLCSDNEVIGLLQLNNKEPDKFDIETIHFFEKVASSIGIALKRKQLEEALVEEKKTLAQKVEERSKSLKELISELEKKQAVLDGINKILRGIMSCETIEGLWKVCLDVAQDLTNSKFGYIGELNKEGTYNKIAISNPGWEACTIPITQTNAIIKNMEIKSYWGKVIKEFRPLIVNDPDSHPDSVGLPEGHPPITSYLGVPFKTNNNSVGLISLANKETGYDESDLEIVETLTIALVEALASKTKDLKLTAQNQELEEANKQKSLFLSLLSHELRTPLNAIVGFSDLLSMKMFGPLNEKQDEYVQLILTNGWYLSSLISDLLDIAKIDAGKVEMQLVVASPVELIKEVVNSMETEFIKKKLNIKTTLEYPFKILLDSKRFKQIIFNLLNNAIKFTPEGGSIEVVLNLEAEDFIQVSVIDNGIGIGSEAINNIFNEFFQVKQESSGSGLGIGLALTRRLVNLHGGDIFVESEVGKGSKFTFIIPIKPGSTDSMNDSAQEIKALSRNKKILVVENQEANRTLLVNLLNSLDHKILTAMNGLEAIDMTKAHKPDLILMAIKMPVMDGYEATIEIRKDEKFKYLPIISMTANATTKEINKSHDAGMNDHIDKPIELKKLIAVLVKWINSDDIESRQDYCIIDPDSVVEDQLVFSKLKGISVNTGLGKVAGNRKLYKKLLLTFYNNNNNVFEEIKTSLEHNDLKKAEYLSHSIRGVSANIGALELFNVSKDLEHCIKNNESDKINDALTKFSIVLSKVLSSIESVKDALTQDFSGIKSGVIEGKVIDKEAIIDKIKKMQELLETDISKAIDIKDEIKEFIAGTDIGSVFLQVEKALDKFDMDTAKIKLLEVANHFK